jgi:hypothetical protein
MSKHNAGQHIDPERRRFVGAAVGRSWLAVRDPEEM